MITYSLIPDALNFEFFGGPSSYSSAQPSGFFPAPQKLEPIRSEIAQPALSLGVPRLTATDAPSIAQTAAWAYQNWFNSPYEAELSIPARPAVPQLTPPTPQASPSFVTEITNPWETMAETVGKSVEYTFIEANKMLPELMLQKLGLMPERQIVNTQGDTEEHVYQTPATSPATVPGVKQEQPQYLFNLGLDPGIKTQAAAIGQPSTAAAIGITPILLLVGLYLFTK